MGNATNGRNPDYLRYLSVASRDTTVLYPCDPGMRLQKVASTSGASSDLSTPIIDYSRKIWAKDYVASFEHPECQTKFLQCCLAELRNHCRNCDKIAGHGTLYLHPKASWADSERLKVAFTPSDPRKSSDV